ncbi:MAG: ABC transporter ATP-binding protein [Chloroflexi bacterium]|nr:ABC transporter ATP-binding protein [Chloroflexota bacterium]
MPEPMLVIEGVRVYYGSICAVDGASLRVDAGETVAIIGSNGAGKSTLLKTISGLMQARAGTIRYAGTDITRASTDRIVAMGISQCPEGRRVFGRMSVRENLVIGGIGRPAADADRDIERMTALFPRLKERLTQAAGTLSGGEQQMLAIARALMSKPRLLILDEPSLGLAPLMVEQVFRIIDDLKSQGLTMLLVEQNVHHALDSADRAYVMETGRIILEGPAKTLRHDPRVEQSYLGL